LEAWLHTRSGMGWFCRRRHIQERKPPLAAQGHKVVRVNQGQEVFEPCGRATTTGRRKIEERGGHRHPVDSSLDPAPEGPFAERLVAIAGGRGPLQGVLDTPQNGVRDGFQNRRDCRLPAPQVGREQGIDQTRAEPQTQDWEIIEGGSTAKIDDTFAEPSTVIAGAVSIAARRTQQTRLGHQGPKIEISTFEGGTVDGQAGCQYTADSDVRFVERSSNLDGKQARFVAGYSVSPETVRAV